MPSREEMGIHLVQGYLFGKPGPIVLSKRDPIDRISERVGGPPPHRGEQHDGLAGRPWNASALRVQRYSPEGAPKALTLWMSSSVISSVGPTKTKPLWI